MRGAMASLAEREAVIFSAFCGGMMSASPVRGLRMRRALRGTSSNLQSPGRINGPLGVSRLTISANTSKIWRDAVFLMPARNASSLIRRLFV